MEGPQHPDCNCQWGPPYQLRSSLNLEEHRMARTKPHCGMNTRNSLDSYVKQNAGAAIAIPHGTTLKCDAGVLILLLGFWWNLKPAMPREIRSHDLHLPFLCILVDGMGAGM